MIVQHTAYLLRLESKNFKDSKGEQKEYREATVLIEGEVFKMTVATDARVQHDPTDDRGTYGVAKVQFEAKSKNDKPFIKARLLAFDSEN